MEEKKNLTEFLREVLGWTWDEFLEAERSDRYTVSQSVIFSLIRESTMDNLKALQTAINRIDGVVETKVRVVLPKVYYLWPNATDVPALIGKEETNDNTPQISEDNDAPTKGLRDTMRRMMDEPKSRIAEIIMCQQDWEAFVRGENRESPENTVKVMSVMVAHLLKMAYARDISAIQEVFNSIDGKMVETLKVVGKDMYITCFGDVAPPGSWLNDKGVIQSEAPEVQTMWQKRLDGTKGTTIEIDL